MNYSYTKEFEKDFKRLLKKYSTLEDDLEVVKKNAIELLHTYSIDNNSIEQVPKFKLETVQIYKIRKFSCKALKGKGCMSGIRIIYALFSQDKRIEFIEMYYKGDKANMDYERVKAYLSNFQ